MGNSSNSKIRQRADSMTIRYKEVKQSKETDTFSKSKSMVELGSKARAKSMGSIRDKPKLTPRDSTKTTSSNGVTRTKSVRRDISHPINASSREIISQCFENPHSEFGNKVLQRIFEKRADFQNYVYALGKERSYQMSVRLKDLVEEVVAKIYDPDYIGQISRAYGEEHVDLKQFGWKPDFWVAIADAITVEGVILDMANHQPADTVAAWSSLVTLMFSSVRDGYYQALRKHRMSSRKVLKRQTTVESQPGIPEECVPSCSTSIKQATPPQGPTPAFSAMESSGSTTTSQLQTGTASSSRRTSSQSVDSESSTTVTKSESIPAGQTVCSFSVNIMAPVVREMAPPPVNCPVLVTSRSSRSIFE